MLMVIGNIMSRTGLRLLGKSRNTQMVCCVTPNKLNGKVHTLYTTDADIWRRGLYSYKERGMVRPTGENRNENAAMNTWASR